METGSEHKKPLAMEQRAARETLLLLEAEGST